MNKVIKEHVPVSELPASLRGEIPDSATVKITLEVEPSRDNAQAMLAKLKAYKETIKGPGTSSEEAVARVRALRDEWDD